MPPSAIRPRLCPPTPWLILAIILGSCSGGSGSGGGSPADPASSTITPSASAGVVANGVEAVTIDVIVRNAKGAPLRGRTVQIAASGSGNQILQPAGTTGVDGLASGELRTTTAELKTLTITVDPGPRAVVLTSSLTIDFIGDAATIDPVRSTMQATPGSVLVADGVESAAITVTVRDVFGNPVPGQAVQLAVDGTGNLLTQPPVLTDAAGRASGALQSTRAATKTVTATVNPGAGPIVLALDTTIEFVGDPSTIDAATSTLVAVPVTAVVADGVTAAAVTVTVRDVNGNPVAGQLVTLSATGADNTLMQPLAATDAAGQAFGSLASTSAETKIVAATVNPGPGAVAVTQTQPVVFVGDPAAISAVLSSVATTPGAGVVADGSQVAAITVTVRDVNGNPVPDRVVQLAAGGVNNILTQPAGLTDTGGVAGGTLASTRAETKTITVTIDPGGSAVVLAATPGIEFVGDPATISASLSGLVPSPAANILADGVATTSVTATVRDVNGNPVAGQTVQLAASGAGNTLAQPAAVTDANGAAVGTLGSTVAETKTLTLTVNPGPGAVVASATPTVGFIANIGTISAGLSSVLAAPGTGVVADGVAASTITVTVRDAEGNPVPGQTVQIALSGSGNTLTQPAAVTDASGVAVASIASIRAESKTVSVTVNPGAGQVVLVQAPLVDFIADASNISVFLSPAAAAPATGVIADGAEASTITVTVRDANGNPVPGQTVQLAATGSDNTVTQPAAATDSSGSATGALASTHAELKAITVTVNPGAGQVVLVQTPTVEFLGDPSTISATGSLASATPSTGVFANDTDTSTLTTVVRDANGNPVAGQTVFYVSDGSGDTIVQPPATTDGNGAASGTIASSAAETKTITVVVNPGPSPVQLTQEPTVEFIPDATISATLSTAVALPTSNVVADGVDSATITVTVRDGLGNVIPGIAVSIAASGSNNTITQPVSPTDGSGVATGSIASTRAETKTLTITVDPGPSQVVLVATPAVAFIADVANINDTLSTAVASPSTGVPADGASQSTLTITVLDDNGNPVAGQPVSLVSSGAGNTITQPAPTDANGMATATLATTVAEVKTLTLTVNPGAGQVVMVQQPTVEFIPSAISASLSTVAAVPSTNVVADGVASATITVTVVDMSGNPVPGQTVLLAASGTNNLLVQPVLVTDGSGVATGTLASTLAETKTITATVNPGPGQVVLDDNPTVAFVADVSTINDTLSTAVASPSANVVADGATTSTVTVTVLDARGNPVPGQTVSLTTTGTGNTLVQPGITNAAGMATGTLASTVAEAKTLTITVNPGAGQVVLVQQPAVDFVADAANISATLSGAVASPATNVVADGTTLSTVTVTILDVNSNPVAGQTVELAVTGTGNTLAQPPATTDVSGVATATIASTAAEAKTITVTVNPGGGQVVLAQQPAVQFVADPSTINAALSLVSASPSANVTADGVDSSTITVTVLDANGNPVSGQTVALAGTGTGNTLSQPAAVTDAAGVATGSIVTTVAESKTLSAIVNPGAGQVVLLQTASVDFIADPGSVSATLTSVTASPATGVIADGVETSTITVTVRDENGNPVPGLSVQLAATGTANTITQPVATTDAGGVATGTIASTEADIKVVTATVDPGPG